MIKEKKYNFFSTCYDKRGKIISRGENNYNKTHPLMQKLSIKIFGKPIKRVLHAEVLSLLRCGDKVPYRIFVERYDTDGAVNNAKPCLICQEAIRLYGVKELHYTSKNGEIIKERK